jgi:glucose-1-phosphate cytidylyltransferase
MAPQRGSSMKVVILAGGRGSRLSEETDVKPKGMVEIGDHPIIWHIMKGYAQQGFKDFVIALGYKAEVFKRYFLDYRALNSHLTVDLRTGKTTVHDMETAEDWTVRLVDTGLTTETGGRIKRLGPWVGNETFMLTWCDALSDVDFHKLLAFHRSHGKLATVTAVTRPSRFGVLGMDGVAEVHSFIEKPTNREEWINAGFFVLEPGVLDYIEGDETRWEKEPLERLARDGQLMAYRHESYWQCMDTLAEKRALEDVWNSGRAPWKTWR